jgi:triosephosphate isomerase
MRTPTFIANWKMNQDLSQLSKYVVGFQQALSDVSTKDCQILIAPMAIHLQALKQFSQNADYFLCAQNCGPAKSGAYTGEISPAAIKELGVSYVLLGHSERRHAFKEDDLLIASKVRAALEAGLKVVLCVGETLQDKKNGKTTKVIEAQLSILKEATILSQFKNLILAYEPVWAIGTGENATPEQAEEVHLFIRNWLMANVSKEAENLILLYGGSVKPENAASLMAKPNVDGLLVGGASLDPGQFSAIIRNGLKNRR